MDDAELIAAVAGGDDAALRELFGRHAPWLAARLRSVLSATDVEDVLQETFLAVWRGARGYRPDGPAGGSSPGLMTQTGPNGTASRARFCGAEARRGTLMCYPLGRAKEGADSTPPRSE